MKRSSKFKKSGTILYQVVARGAVAHENFSGRTPVRVMPYNQQTVDTKALASLIADRCLVKEPDIRAALTALGEVIRETLLDGDRIVLDDIGTFNLSLALKKTLTDGSRCEPKTVGDSLTAADIEVGHIIFTPCKELREAMRQARFESSGVRPSDPLTPADIDTFLTQHFSTEYSLTRRQFESHFDISRDKAIQHLTALVVSKNSSPVASATPASTPPPPATTASPLPRKPRRPEPPRKRQSNEYSFNV